MFHFIIIFSVVYNPFPTICNIGQNNYLWIYSRFNAFFINHKWNRTRFLSPESKCTSKVSSRIAERLKTWDLKKLGNFKKTPAVLGTKDKHSTGHQKKKNLLTEREDYENCFVKHLLEKRILFNFVNCSKFTWGKTFLFPTQPRSLAVYIFFRF